MKFLKLFIPALFVFVSFLVAPVIFAEEVNNKIPEETKSIVNINLNVPQKANNFSSANILNPKINSQDNGVFDISFSLINKEGVQSGLKYGVRLAKKVPNGVNIIDEKIYDELVTLYEGDNISKNIKYQAPSGAIGEYVLYLTLKNNNGFSFGSSFLGKVTLSIPDNGVRFLNETCYLSIDSVSDKKFSLIQGIDIKENENIILNCQIENFSLENKSVFPEYETHLRNIYGDIIPHVGGDYSSFEINSQEKKDISLILPKNTNPQAYDVVIKLKDSDGVYSNEIVSHYVLSGNSATIQNINLDKDFYKEGETANISFLWSPRADSFPGSRSGSLDTNYSSFVNLVLKNNKGDFCSDEVNKELFTNYVDPNVIIPVTIIKECKNPVIDLIIKDKDGNILDQDNFSVKSKYSFPIFVYYIIVGLLFVSGILFYFLRKKKNSNNSIAIFVIGLIISGMGILLPSNKINAASFTFGDTGGYFVRVPYTLNYGDSYNPGDTISVSFGEVEFSACNNALTNFVLTANDQPVFDYTHNEGDSYPVLLNTIELTAPSESGSYDIEVRGRFTTTFSDETSIVKSSTGYIPYDVNGDAECSGTHYECENGERDNSSEGLNEWTWTCSGYGNGEDRTCSESRSSINGSCSGEHYKCLSGQMSHAKSNPTNWTWTCNGIGGGSPDTCSEEKGNAPDCGDNLYSCEIGSKGFSSKDTDTEAVWVCYVNGYPHLECTGVKTNPICGENEKFTCIKGIVKDQREDNSAARWGCVCDGTDCNTDEYSVCTMWKPIDGQCNPTKKNECIVGDYDDSDNVEDFSWKCLGKQDGGDVECSLDPNTMQGNIETHDCIIQMGESGCEASFSWEVFNSEEGSSTVYKDGVSSYVGYGDSGSGVLTMSGSEVLTRERYQYSSLSLFNNNKELDSSDIRFYCVDGAGWNNIEGKCLRKVNGGWSDWGECKLNNYSNYVKTRYCNNPSPENGGSYCTTTGGYGSNNSETITCTPSDSNKVSVIGPTVFNIGTTQTFGISSISTGKVNYNIDWNGDKEMNLENDQYYPANRSGVIPSIIQRINHKWDKLGEYTFNVQSMDYHTSKLSGWTPWTVKVKDSTAEISADKDSVLPDENVTLTWNATNVDYCRGNFPIIEKTREKNCSVGNEGKSSVCTGYDISGSYTYSPSSFKKYEIYCPNINNTKTATDDVFVRVTGIPSTSSLELDSSPIEINKGESSDLHWNTVNLSMDSYACKIVDDSGKIIAGSDNTNNDLLTWYNWSGQSDGAGGSYHSGVVPVSPQKTTKYEFVCNLLKDDATVIVGDTPIPDHCTNKTRDYDEDDVDCGGIDCVGCKIIPKPQKLPVFIEI